ncbi:hypothetical protein [Saccharothrix texasensis]|uniref:Uncharacterized protein n=1 Tax=Saccharothrix texasensis TaxID=103734 RepID=A0A3N1HBY6_9PSEU|nr:hypothetical protein [Saccharothrix texasensis]ROP40015.1 hypothetical protein EDD40_5418 [Saccharothrix texasensis]
MSDAAAGDANDWEWVRVLAQGRVYDEDRAPANRLAWAAVALAASHGGERSGVRRARAVADRFALRARVTRSLGAWAADPDALAEDVMAEDGLSGRYEKSVARAVEPVVPRVRDEEVRERLSGWVRARA